eukprot:4972554-Alexandrium_andersonii.AAC.1
MSASLVGSEMCIRDSAGADFAGRLRARRSTCGGVCVRGAHTTKHWSTTVSYTHLTLPTICSV